MPRSSRTITAAAAATAAVLAACLVAVAAAPAQAWRPNHRHYHVSREQLAAESGGGAADGLGLPEAQFFDQRLDHFDATDETFYQQRYYVNDTFFEQAKNSGVESPPVFLYIEGEGAASPYNAYYGHHMDMARAHGALVLAVEHRYYGASVPTETLSTENLRWLSSQQALADLARFHDFAEERWALSSNTTWISFGGSYPGSLSAWLRLKYPHVVYGAVASSAPVLAKVNYQGYNEVIASALAMELVGGSEECLERVNKAFVTVQKDLATEAGRKALGAQFGTCTPLETASANDQDTFVEGLSGLFQGVIQYNDEAPGSPNVRSMCQRMLNHTAPLDGLAAVKDQQYQGECMDISYNDSVAELYSTKVDRNASGVGIRQWIYQSCTQFSYWQTCDADTTCPFHSPRVNLNASLAQCESLFGMSAGDVEARTRFTNDYYGGLDLQGSRILMVDGSVDPWHVLSILDGVPDTTVTSLFMQGTAHCANMNSALPDDPPALTEGRRKIEAQVSAWLREASAAAQM